MIICHYIVQLLLVITSFSTFFKNFSQICKSAMEEGEANNTNNFRLHVAEGDTCFRLGLFQKAINSYTAALDIRKDRNVLIARSKSYASLGMNDEAIQDATDSVGNDTNFYRGYYQLAQAYFVAGLFEEALVYYYRAYRKRPDIQEYRLGVQKAEESILRAIDTGIDCVDELAVKCNLAPTVEEIEALYQSEEMQFTAVDGGEVELGPNAFRCLCGCPHCDPKTCDDLVNQEFEPLCTCRCEACLHHLAYKHNHILDPISNTLISIQSVLDETNHTDSAMLSPGQTPLTSRVKVSGTSTSMLGSTRQSALEREFRQEQSLRKKYKTAGDLAPDRAFLELLQQDSTLTATCGSVKPIISSGIEFIDKRSEFWRQQAQGTAQSNQTITGRKTVTKSSLSRAGTGTLSSMSIKRVPQPLGSSCVSTNNSMSALDSSEVAGKGKSRSKNTRLAQLRAPGKKTVQDIVELIQHIQQQIELGNLDDALTDAKLADQYATALTVNPADKQAAVEKDMLLADIQTCIGCLLYDTNRPGVSVQRFRHALTLNTGIKDVRGIIRSLRNLGRVLLAVGDYPSAKESYEGILPYIEATNDNGELVCPRYIIAEACINAAKCVIDSGVQGPAFDYLKSALHILSGGTFMLDDVGSDIQLNYKDPELDTFRSRAPSFFVMPDSTPNELALDALCLAGKLYYGSNSIEESKKIFILCKEKAHELRDVSAEKAALVNLKFLAMQESNESLAEHYQAEIDSLSAASQVPSTFDSVAAGAPVSTSTKKKSLSIKT